MLVVGPDIPAALQPFAQAVLDALEELRHPAAPAQLPAVETAADLPPADAWQECGIIVRAGRYLAISTWSGSAWGWLRSDGSAL